MNKETKNRIIAWIIVCAIFGFIFGGAGLMIHGTYKITELRADNLETCRDLTGEENVTFNYIDETHFNCCWEDIRLDANKEYYLKERCLGFSKETEETK